MHQRNRRGMSVLEWTCILGGLSIVLFLGIRYVGSAVKTQIQKETTTGWLGQQAGVNGNNGLGNGEDPQPSAAAVENDTNGATPGSPGARN